MKFVTELSNIRQPELMIPRNYTIREATGSAEDLISWNKIITILRAGEPYPTGEHDKVWFVDYCGVPIGFESVVVPKQPNNVVYMWAGVVLPEHQRKGLHTALTHYRLKYARETGRKYVKVACRETLDNWWRRHLIIEPNT